MSKVASCNCGTVSCRLVSASLLSDPNLFGGENKHIMPAILAVVRRMAQPMELAMCGQDETMHLPTSCSGCESCFKGVWWKAKAIFELFGHTCKRLCHPC